jgi:acetyl-CoA carboxylase, biotin carboxylase subunit
MNKVLVANRGEIALRVIRACRELGLETVGVFTEPDEAAMHIRKADEAVLIGPRRAYLDVHAVIAAARATGADAVHPGYGFLAENAEFAAACRRAGLTFVGPSAEVIAVMGDKARARALAREAGVPTIPGSDGTTDPAEALDVAAAIGYPVMVKAAAGGGGRGIRVARDAAELTQVAKAAEQEAEAAFGDGRLYIERLIAPARHVEVQVVGDAHGNVVHLWERECSLQRRRQKVVEEAPSPALDPGRRAALADAGVRLARHVGYVNAGTLEFLVGPDGDFFFIEMNTRIQVEHPVTEMVTGIDLVKEQLRVAAGSPLSFRQEDVEIRGTSIEFRINAEDAEHDFRPSPGLLTAVELPGGPGVRTDTAIYGGYTVTPFYDSLIGKLVVWGRDREEAIERGRRALAELVIDGIATTTSFHLRLLDDEGFRLADFDTDYLARLPRGSGTQAAGSA